MDSYAIDLSNVIKFSDEQFYQLCRNNPDLKFERLALPSAPRSSGEASN
jgi:hypothetical protein